MEIPQQEVPTISYMEKGRLYLSLCRKARLLHQQEEDRKVIFQPKEQGGDRETLFSLFQKQNKQFLEHAEVDAEDMKYLFGRAPAALHSFLERTRLLPELFLHGHCLYTVGERLSGSPFDEYGFESLEDAVAKLKSLAEAWKDEVSMETFPIAARNKVLVEITAKN